MKKRLNLPVNTYVVELYGRETACWGYGLCLYIDGTKYIFEPQQNFCYNNADTRQWRWLHSDPLTIPIGMFYLERHDQTSAGFEEIDVIRIRKYTSPDQTSAGFEEIDVIRIRKYTSPEPTFTLSPEIPTTKPIPVPTQPTSKIKAADSGGWKYYKEITVNENSGKALTDYPVLVELNSANFDFSKAKFDGSDIRFAADGEELNYWIEEWDAVRKKAKIWVKVPSIPANGVTKIKMWYGNPSASAVSDGDKVFEFFDDFERDEIGDEWEIDPGLSASIEYDSEKDGRVLVLQHSAGSWKSRSISKPIKVFNTPIVFSWRGKAEDWESSPICGFIDRNGNLSGNHFGYFGDHLQHYFSGQSYHEATDYRSTTWHQWNNIVKKNEMVTYLDDAYWRTITSKIDCLFFERIQLTARTHGISSVTAKFDDIIVRKYTTPKPTLTLSAEHITTKPTPTITPTPTPPTPPSGKIKAVWLYNPDKYDTSTLMTDFKSAGINTIFLSTDVNNIWKYERFVKSAHENGIEVHAMILEDPRCALKENHASSIKAVETVLDYNDKSLAKFDGINIDTEPYVDLDLEQVWEDYITLLDAIHEKTAGKTVLSADIPRWYDEAKMKDLAPNVDFFAIMAYDSGDVGWNTASEIEDAVASEMGAIRGEGSKAVIGIGVHEGFEDKEAVEKCVDGLYRYYSGDSAFSGVSIFKYESYSGLSGASEAPTEGIPEIPTGEEKGIPGFEAIIAMVGLLAVAYVLRRRK
jgi:PGF-CTERM protein